ncbi:Uncharacterized protein HZ326_26061 [Fusarium oxysporum f. sp. albedinis]|nr:Uncharacterized protein HZ326_26061 [Fusarium oxysporum f. sp. albedinis]
MRLRSNTGSGSPIYTHSRLKYLYLEASGSSKRFRNNTKCYSELGNLLVLQRRQLLLDRIADPTLTAPIGDTMSPLSDINRVYGRLNQRCNPQNTILPTDHLVSMRKPKKVGGGGSTRGLRILRPTSKRGNLDGNRETPRRNVMAYEPASTSSLVHHNSLPTSDDM